VRGSVRNELRSNFLNPLSEQYCGYPSPFHQYNGLACCKLFIFCKILAWRGDGGLFRDFGSLNSYYLLHFHQYIGLKDKLFSFIRILAL